MGSYDYLLLAGAVAALAFGAFRLPRIPSYVVFLIVGAWPVLNVSDRYGLTFLTGSLMVAIGPDNFREMLHGFHAMDEHFRTSPFAQNIPVLMALSRKDFVGETLDLAVDERLEGTLAATAVAAWLGARVFRTHDVRATRRTLDTSESATNGPWSRLVRPPEAM